MLLFETLFFATPIYAANVCAALSMSIPKLKDLSTPIDFGKTWNNKRILGDGKTYRGLIFGTFCGVLIGLLQYTISKQLDFEYLKDFNQASLDFFVITSFLLGFGALVGDSTKSFFKRRIGIKRGRPWPPFDQLDFIVGGLLFISPVYFPGWKIVLVLAIITPILHFLTNVIGYFLKLKDVWW